VIFRSVGWLRERLERFSRRGFGKVEFETFDPDAPWWAINISDGIPKDAASRFASESRRLIFEKWHSVRQFRVEDSGLGWRARHIKGGNVRGGEILKAEHLPVAVLEALMFLARDQHRALAFVAGDGDRTAQRQILTSVCS
jgi:hypothetical protein